MRRFLNWWRGKSVKGTGKELQHHIDTYKIYTLAHYKKIINEQGGVDKATLIHDKDEQKDFFDMCQDSSLESQQQFIKEHVTKEILNIFNVFYEKVPLKVPQSEDELIDTIVEVDQAVDPNSFPLFVNSRSTTKPSAKSISNFNKMNDAMMEKLGYSLNVRQSKIPNAGQGVFLNGKATAGTVISLYPGIVYLKEYVVSGDIAGMFGPDDSGLYTMSRYDGSIFNGDCTLKWHPSPISHGHLIRHPTGILPRSQDHHGLPKILGKANVMSCPFNFPVLESAAINKKGGFLNSLVDDDDDDDNDDNDYTLQEDNVNKENQNNSKKMVKLDIDKFLEKKKLGKKFPTEFRPYIPNAYYKPPVLLSTQEAKESYTFGIALIATENIENEEIYLDYRYNPHLDTPSWYKTIDEESAQRRWKEHTDNK